MTSKYTATCDLWVAAFLLFSYYDISFDITKYSHRHKDTDECEKKIRSVSLGEKQIGGIF